MLCCNLAYNKCDVKLGADLHRHLCCPTSSRKRRDLLGGAASTGAPARCRCPTLWAWALPPTVACAFPVRYWSLFSLRSD